MCLAKVYIRSGSGSSEELIMENVTRVLVKEDGRVQLTSLLNATEDVPGRITSVDLMASRLVLERTGPA
jgi:predicted RNA-binding protein